MIPRATPLSPGRFYRWATGVLEAFAALLLLAALLDMLLQVGARTFMSGGAPAWTEEGVRVALVWITFTGAAAATLRGHHLVVDMFPTVSGTLRRAWDLAIALLLATLGICLLYGAAVLTDVSWPNVTSGLGWSGSMYYIPLLIFAGVVLIHAVRQALAAGAALARGAAAQEQAPCSRKVEGTHQR